MPRAFVPTPASALKDNVAGLLSRPAGDDIESSWQDREAARRREEYSAELRAQIAAKEAARQLERTPRPAAAPSYWPAAREQDGPEEPAIESAAVDAADGTIAGLPAIRTAVPLESAPPPCPPFTEKERFIAAMEWGITLSPKGARRRSVTAPGPAPAPAPAAPPRRPSSADGDEAAARQHLFKLDLDRQIEEKKRLKALERERERRWEAEQEARLERERAQLRQQFEEEHAARRAKVAVQATGSSKGGPGIQIFAPKGRPGAAAAAGVSHGPAGKAAPSGATADPSSSETASAPSSSGAAAKGEHPAEAAPAAVDAPEPSSGPPPAQGPAWTPSAQVAPGGTGDPAAMAAACAALAGQVAELRRLHEAVRRELSLQKAALDAGKVAELSAATTLVTLAQVPGGSGGGGSAAPPLPILHSTAELRNEDSRPSSSRSISQMHRRGGGLQAQSSGLRSKLGGGLALTPAGHAAASIGPLRSQTPPVLAETVAQKLDGLRLAQAAASHPQMLIAAVPAGGRCQPPALTAKLVPVWRSERAGFWKTATKKLRKLTVARAAGGADGRWVEQEDSRSSDGGH